MKISEQGIKLIKDLEGCQLKAYDDGTGTYTIGYGHTLGVRKGQVITQSLADYYLKEDIIRYENGVNDLVKVAINQNKFDALVSFSFNVGVGALENSTLLREINRGNIIKEEYFTRWSYAGGVQLQGLINRRKKEYKLYTQDEENINNYSPTIRYLQESINLDGKKILQDGILGPQTLGALPVLKYGSTGYVVKWLQSHFSMLTIDGMFGQKTEQKIKEFQSINSLEVDGIVGINTWKRILYKEA